MRGCSARPPTKADKLRAAPTGGDNVNIRRESMISVASLLFLAVPTAGQETASRLGPQPVAITSTTEKPDTGSVTQLLLHPADHFTPWETMNSGGAPASSADYQLDGSLGQSVIGLTVGSNQEHGIGFWYGVEFCDCKDFCNLDLVGSINPIDVVIIVKYVYKGEDLRQRIPTCPANNGDWNCDGAVNPVDVVHYVNYVYKGMIGKPPCDPCTCSPYPANCPPWP